MLVFKVIEDEVPPYRLCVVVVNVVDSDIDVNSEDFECQIEGNEVLSVLLVERVALVSVVKGFIVVVEY